MFPYENLSFNWSNSSKNHLNEETVHLLCSTLCRPDAIPASGRRRATPRVGNRAPTPLFTLHWPGSFRSVHPYPFPELLRRARARVAAVRRAGHGSPPRLDSSHPELRNLAPTPLRPIRCLLESFPGRFRRFRRGHHCCPRRAPPPLRRAAPPTILRIKSNRGELPGNLLSLSDAFPTRIHSAPPPFGRRIAADALSAARVRRRASLRLPARRRRTPHRRKPPQTATPAA